MTTTIENFLNNKRKFLSDDEGYPSSARFLSLNDQIPTNCNAKKLKSMETDRLSSTTMEYEETSEMMVCEGSTSTKSDVQQTTEITNKSAEIISAKHHDSETNPTALVMRCYCDPFRLNTLFPHNSNLY